MPPKDKPYKFKSKGNKYDSLEPLEQVVVTCIARIHHPELGTFTCGKPCEVMAFVGDKVCCNEHYKIVYGDTPTGARH